MTRTQRIAGLWYGHVTVGLCLRWRVSFLNAGLNMLLLQMASCPFRDNSGLMDVWVWNPEWICRVGWRPLRLGMKRSLDGLRDCRPCSVSEMYPGVYLTEENYGNFGLTGPPVQGSRGVSVVQCGRPHCHISVLHWHTELNSVSHSDTVQVWAIQMPRGSSRLLLISFPPPQALLLTYPELVNNVQLVRPLLIAAQHDRIAAPYRRHVPGRNVSLLFGCWEKREGHSGTHGN